MQTEIKKHKFKLLFLFTIIVFAYISSFKIHLYKSIPYFSPTKENAFYYTEGALQYRFARFIAEGKHIPYYDWMLQFPEGVFPFRQFTLLMEYVSGFIYKILHLKIPFHLYLVYFVCLFSSLSIFGIYFLSYSLYKDWKAIFWSILFYAFSVPSFGRIIGNFGREFFAPPLIIFAVGFFIRYLENKKTLDALFFILFYILSILSWHLSQFFFVVFFSPLLIFRIKTLVSLRKIFLITAITNIIMYLTSPLLFEKKFIISTLSLQILTLLIISFLKNNYQRILILIFSTLLVVFFSNLNKDYAHVYNLLLYKIKFLGIKPPSPAQLPLDVRMMWIEAFNSLGWRNFLKYWVSLTFIFIFSLLKTSSFRNPKLKLVILNSLLFFILSVLIRRLGIFGVMFLSLNCGLILSNTNTRYRLAKWSVILSVLFLWQSFITLNVNKSLKIKEIIDKKFSVKTSSPAQLHLNLEELIRWILFNTEPREAILAHFGTSASFLVYANRPIILHSKFESAFLRRKVKEFNISISKDERTFYNFCKKYKARWFVYETPFLLRISHDSLRYILDKLKISKKDLLYKFHFKPQELKYFHLVYQNSNFRVFYIGKYLPKRKIKKVLFYQPVFDEKFIGDVNNLDNLIYKLKILDSGYNLLNEALNYLQYGLLELASQTLRKIENINPSLIGLHLIKGRIYMLRGKPQKALQEFKKELQISPYLPPLYQDLLRFYYTLKDNNNFIFYKNKLQKINQLYK